MSTFNDTDILLVERNGNLHQFTYDQMSTLNDNDILLVERDGVKYKVEAQYVSGDTVNGIINGPVEVLTPVNGAGSIYFPVTDPIVDVERYTSPVTEEVTASPPPIISATPQESTNTVDIYSENWFQSGDGASGSFHDTEVGDVWTRHIEDSISNKAGTKYLTVAQGTHNYYTGTSWSEGGYDIHGRHNDFDQTLHPVLAPDRYVWIYDFKVQCPKNTRFYSIQGQGTDNIGAAYSDDGVTWTTFVKNGILQYGRYVFADLPVPARYVCVYKNDGGLMKDAIYAHLSTTLYGPTTLSFSSSTGMENFEVGQTAKKFKQLRWGDYWDTGRYDNGLWDENPDGYSTGTNANNGSMGLGIRVWTPPEPIKTNGIRIRMWTAGKNTTYPEKNKHFFINGFDRTNELSNGLHTYYFGDVQELRSLGLRYYNGYQYSYAYKLEINIDGQWITLTQTGVNTTTDARYAPFQGTTKSLYYDASDGQESIITAIDRESNPPTMTVTGPYKWNPLGQDESEFNQYQEYISEYRDYPAASGNNIYDGNVASYGEGYGSYVNHLFDGTDRPVYVLNYTSVKWEPPAGTGPDLSAAGSTLRFKGSTSTNGYNAYFKINGSFVDTIDVFTVNANPMALLDDTYWADIDIASLGITRLDSFEFGYYSTGGSEDLGETSSGRTAWIQMAGVEVNGVEMVDNKGCTNIPSVTLSSFTYDTKLTLASNASFDYLVDDLRMSDGVANNNGVYEQTPYTVNLGNITHVSRYINSSTFTTNSGTTGPEHWDHLFYETSRNVGTFPELSNGQWREITFNPPLKKTDEFSLYCRNYQGGSGGILINGIEVGQHVDYTGETSWAWTDFAPHIVGDTISSIRVQRSTGYYYGAVLHMRMDGRTLTQNDYRIQLDNVGPDIQYLEKDDALQTRKNWYQGSWSDQCTFGSGQNIGHARYVFDGRDDTNYYYNYLDVYFHNFPDVPANSYRVRAYPASGGGWMDIYTTSGTFRINHTDNNYAPHDDVYEIDIPGALTRIYSYQYAYIWSIEIKDPVDGVWKRMVDHDVDGNLIDVTTSKFLHRGVDSNEIYVYGGNYYADPANGGDGTSESAQGYNSSYPEHRANNTPWNMSQDWSSTVTIEGPAFSTSYPVAQWFDGRIEGNVNNRGWSYGITYDNSDKTLVRFETPIPFHKLEMNGYLYGSNTQTGEFWVIDSGGPGGTERLVQIFEEDTSMSAYMYARRTICDLNQPSHDMLGVPEGGLVSPLRGFGIRYYSYISAIYVDGALLVDPNYPTNGMFSSNQGYDESTAGKPRTDLGGRRDTGITYETKGGRGTLARVDKNNNAIYVFNSTDPDERFIIGKVDSNGQPGNTGGTGDPANAIDFRIATPQPATPVAALNPSTITFTSQNAGTVAFTGSPQSRVELSSRTWTLETGPTAEGPWTLVDTYEDIDMNSSQDGSTPWSGRPTLQENTYYRVKVAYNSPGASQSVESGYNTFKTGTNS